MDNLYKKRQVKRTIVLFVTILMLVHTAFIGASTVLADTWPYKGDAAVGDNQPRMVGQRIYDLENWSPETDPYAELMRANVPLQERNEPLTATQAKPNLKSEAEMLVMGGDYGNSFFEGLPYNNDFSQYQFNFWQYTDYYASWHGVVTKDVPKSLYDPEGPWQTRFFEFGIINVPNPAYTNAAHKNGVKSLGCVFLPRAGQAPKQMIVQDKNGDFPIGKKLNEFAKYYGFDGFFINLEETVPTADVPIYKQFTKYLIENGLYIQWYDSILPNGNLQYQNQLNENNSHWIKDNQYGTVNSSLFVNYDWFRSNRIETSLEHAAKKGIDPFKQVFFGVEAAQGELSGSHGSASGVENLLDQTGNLRGSVALFTPSDFIQLHLERKAEEAENQWMIAERERMYYSGVLMDPTNTGKKPGYSRPDVDAKDASGWVGVAHFASERSVINGSTFFTNFNTGHGMEYYQKGEVANDHQWSNINLQDILPTWQWWIDTTSKNKLSVDFDYGKKYNTKAYDYTKVGAYDGGSSLVVTGKLDADNFLHLYKTNLDIAANSKLSITYNKPSQTDHSEMKLGLIFKDEPNKIEYISVPDANKKSESWVTKEFDLSKFKGKEVAALGLSFGVEEGSVIEKYQINIGEIKMTNGSVATPDIPTGFTVKKAFDTNEMIVTWDIEDYSKVKLYNLYANLSNGKRVYLGGTYGNTFYIKSLYGEKDIVNLELKAVGPDKTESLPATTSYDFSTKVRNLTVKEALTPSGNLLQSANAGTLDISWKNPDIDYSSINIEVSFNNSTNKEKFKKTVKKGTTSTQIIVPMADGSEYTLALSVVGTDNKQGEPILYTGKLKDVYIEPYNGEIDVAKSGTTYYMSLDAPRQEDWWRIYAYVDGKPLTFQNEYTTNTLYGTRGKSYLNSSTPSKNIKLPSASGIVTIVLEDYSGNKSEPATYFYGEPKKIDSTMIPDTALLAAIQKQVGDTTKDLFNFTGKLDLSNSNVSDLTGISLLTNISSIDLTNSTRLTTIKKGTFSSNLKLKEVIVSGLTNLQAASFSDTAIEKLTYNHLSDLSKLISLDLSNAKFDMTEGTPERTLADMIGHVDYSNQRPIVYIGDFENNTISLEVNSNNGEFDPLTILPIVTVRGNNYLTLADKKFLADDFDINKQVSDLNLLAQVTNPSNERTKTVDTTILGTHQVSYKSLTKDKKVGSLKINVIAKVKNVKELVERAKIEPTGIRNALLVQLENAEKHFKKAEAFTKQGKEKQAEQSRNNGYKTLESLIDWVKKQSDKHIDKADAAQVISMLEHIVSNETMTP
ncbi:endo-beta-N-acetylglucosaminidase [Heyndrickxia sp. NPDC080065]|uniref:endo-beta-N-acetylglucosaminidase n=1 Tax=Heyndrickxia sp. NPDC080065 TaxID=3390568 RepID=UPI003D00A766